MRDIKKIEFLKNWKSQGLVGKNVIWKLKTRSNYNSRSKGRSTLEISRRIEIWVIDVRINRVRNTVEEISNVSRNWVGDNTEP